MKNKIVSFLNKKTAAEAAPQTRARSSFEEDDNDNLPKPNTAKGISITNAKSNINRPEPVFNISENAKAILANQELRKRAAVDLTMSLITLFKDKTLDENKDPERKKAETQILKDYIEFVKLLNDAEDEDDGAGTLGFTLALMKVCILQRDRINELEYEVKTTSKKLEQYIKTNKS